MRSLLDNRKDLTPQQSMESLVKYARNQDSAIHAIRLRSLRAKSFFSYAFFGITGLYVLYQFTAGYWTSHHPRNFISANLVGVTSKKRQYYTPELYLRDQQNWKAVLKKHQLEYLKKSANQTNQE